MAIQLLIYSSRTRQYTLDCITLQAYYISYNFCAFSLFFSNNIPNSADLVFFDSSSNMEEYNFTSLHSSIGVLPLGIIITIDETTSTLIQALDMFKIYLPQSASTFFKKQFFNFPLEGCWVLQDNTTLNQPNRFTVSRRINETFGCLSKTGRRFNK